MKAQSVVQGSPVSLQEQILVQVDLLQSHPKNASKKPFATPGSVNQKKKSVPLMNFHLKL